MIRSGIAVLLLLAGISSAWSAPKLDETLAARIDKNIEIHANTPLKEALDFLSDRFKLTLIIDDKAFRTAGIQDVGLHPVQLPKVNKAQLGTVVQVILNEVGATYQVKKDHLQIVPRPKGKALVDLLPAASKELLARLKQGIGKEIEVPANVPLRKALGLISEVCDVTLVFDTSAFRAAGINAIEGRPVELAKQPAAIDLDATLQRLLKQAGATYQARDNLILVVPARK